LIAAAIAAADMGRSVLVVAATQADAGVLHIRLDRSYDSVIRFCPEEPTGPLPRGMIQAEGNVHSIARLNAKNRLKYLL